MAEPISTPIGPEGEVDRLADDGSKDRKRITITVSNQLVDLIDQLRKDWKVRARGTVVERLLEDLLIDPESSVDEASEADSSFSDINGDDLPDETTSLVLISRSEVLTDDVLPPTAAVDPPSQPSSPGIDLPGFVRKRTTEIKASLRATTTANKAVQEPPLSTVCADDLIQASSAAETHWRSLYGQPPGDTVVEAAMAWLSRDVWPSVDASDGRAFTWSAANQAMHDLCVSWADESPSLGVIMVIAGALEDPFATASLAERMPTLIRRFVNRFRRSRKVTSFETLESTMTVHGALKLLGLSTQPGASVTLASIRESYKTRALEEHPDAGGSTDGMRRLNEAYKLLRELYRSR